ncbi:hypothetical protein PVAR5_1995 [Paecilomyces variotii No. 5]|uniref:Uncharacterized protein n=1 Tax=Byssochlamys spectabilis (strain No. 5 / NBRC 109023) TaxID=1356009 RepID=V5HUT0_BYSSN|nr:hypothetical protein PVAR5_1995 [Paecilomyces variotii No. 5]
MLSAKHHLLYWILSTASATIYAYLPSRVIALCPIFLSVLIPYAVYFVLVGPQRYSNGGWGFRLVHCLATGCLLVSLGWAARYLSERDHDEVKKGTGGPLELEASVIHTLLGFMILGVLEPVRQNRTDIEPLFLLSFPRINYFRNTLTTSNNQLVYPRLIYAVIVTLTMSLGLLYAFERVLLRVLGADTTTATSTYRLRSRLLLHTDVTTTWLGVGLLMSPFLDAADTIFLLTHLYLFPHWMPQGERYESMIHDDKQQQPQWTCRKLQVVRSLRNLAVAWLVWMVPMRYLIGVVVVGAYQKDIG